MKSSAYARALSAASSCVLIAALGGRADAQDAWTRFEARIGAKLELRRSEVDLVEIVGSARVVAPIGGAADALRSTLDVLAAADELLGAPAGELVLVHRSEVAGVHVVQLEQQVEGLPVLGSAAEATWTSDGRLLSLRARGLARSRTIVDAVLRRGEAADVARAAAPRFERAWARAPRMALARSGDELRAVYVVAVFDPTTPGAEWAVTLDAVDGSIREIRSTRVEGLGGLVTGRGNATGTQFTAPPTTLAMGNVQVIAVDRAIAFARITDNVCGDAAVAISADASRVAWVSSCDGDRELWTAASDGSGALQLTTNSADDRAPTISSDGSRIVFVSNADGDDELWSIGSDGTGLAQLTFNGSSDHSPSLTADGSRVAYIAESDGDPELCTLLVASPSPTQLTFDSAADADPRIAADGSRIAWVSRSDGDADVCTIEPSGAGFVRVTLNSVDDTAPDITADGLRVVFASTLPTSEPEVGDPSAGAFQSLGGGFAKRARVLKAFEARDVFEAASDGSSLQRLTDSDADERAPSYATAGGCVAYVTDEDGDDEIELLDVAGGTLMRLTDDATDDRAPRVASACGAGAWVADDGDGEIFAWNLMLPGASAIGHADDAGVYALAWPDGASPSVETRLRGRYARVTDLDPRWSNARANASATTPTVAADLVLNSTGAVEGPTAQVTAYHHANRAHDALAAVLTRPPLSIATPLAIDAPLRVRANFPDAIANAFYSSSERAATFFIGAGPMRPNTACETLVLHEYGHYFDDVHGGLSAGSSCEAPIALSEGIGDALAMFVTGQPIIGEDFYGLGTSVRDYTKAPWLGAGGVAGQQYGCETCTVQSSAPEVHEHGAAFAGFAWDLRSAVGALTAENLIFGALTANPPDMQSAVFGVFSLAATPAFGGTGDPATSPLSGSICAAAARHGFDCSTRPDQGSHGCVLGLCAAIVSHRTIGTEWLGATFDGELSCEAPPNPDDDGLFFPSPVMSDETKSVTITLSVAPPMKSSGRYGAPPAFPQLHGRRVYVNAWMFIDDAMGGFYVVKVLGTGSTSPTAGPNNLPGTGNTLAFNPDTWAGSSLAYACDIVVPAVPTPRLAILRVRLDYGENAGAIGSCLSHPSLDEACGIARFGEVEDYQTIIMPR